MCGATRLFAEFFINGIVQFIGLSQIWGSGFPYFVHIWDHIESTGWGSRSNINTGSGTAGSKTVAGIWGGRFTHSTINWSGNWYRSINASSDYSPRSPASTRVARRCIRKDFLPCRRQQRIWYQSNRPVCWQRQDRDILMVRPLNNFWSKVLLLV